MTVPIWSDRDGCGRGPGRQMIIIFMKLTGPMDPVSVTMCAGD
jgi:hypothetical protein